MITSTTQRRVGERTLHKTMQEYDGQADSKDHSLLDHSLPAQSLMTNMICTTN